MASPVKHTFTSAKSDGGDATVVRPSDWNAAHAITYAGATALAVVMAGPFTVNYNDANVLTTGVTLWTPAAGDVIYDISVETTTAFAATGGSGTIDQVTAALNTTNDVVVASSGNLKSLSAGTDVVNIPKLIAAPWVVKAAQPVKATIEILDDDTGFHMTPTAGVLKFYAMVGVK